MNREVIQNILLGVFGLALIIIGFAIYMQSQAISNVTTRIDTLSQSMMESSDKLHEAAMKMDDLSQKMDERAMKDEQAMMSANSVTVSGLTFDLPDTWSVESVSGTTARLNVPDPNYHVIIPFTVTNLTGAANAPSLTSKSLLSTTASGMNIYSDACAPALLCSIVENNGDVYSVVFEEPESDEPVPENLDGVWFPSTTVTQQEMEDVIASVH